MLRKSFEVVAELKIRIIRHKNEGWLDWLVVISVSATTRKLGILIKRGAGEELNRLV